MPANLAVGDPFNVTIPATTSQVAKKTKYVVKVPEDSQAGDSVTVHHNGQEYTVSVPEGKAPGETFKVSIPDLVAPASDASGGVSHLEPGKYKVMGVEGELTVCKFRLKLMVDGTLRGKKKFEQAPMQSCAVSGSWKNNSMDWTYEYKMADGTIHTYSDRYVVQLCSCGMADVLWQCAVPAGDGGL